MGYSNFYNLQQQGLTFFKKNIYKFIEDKELNYTFFPPQNEKEIELVNIKVVGVVSKTLKLSNEAGDIKGCAIPLPDEINKITKKRIKKFKILLDLTEYYYYKERNFVDTDDYNYKNNPKTFCINNLISRFAHELLHVNQYVTKTNKYEDYYSIKKIYPNYSDKKIEKIRQKLADENYENSKKEQEAYIIQFFEYLKNAKESEDYDALFDFLYQYGDTNFFIYPFKKLINKASHYGLSDELEKLIKYIKNFILDLLKDKDYNSINQNIQSLENIFIMLKLNQTFFPSLIEKIDTNDEEGRELIETIEYIKDKSFFKITRKY